MAFLIPFVILGSYHLHHSHLATFTGVSLLSFFLLTRIWYTSLRGKKRKKN